MERHDAQLVAIAGPSSSPPLPPPTTTAATTTTATITAEGVSPRRSSRNFHHPHHHHAASSSSPPSTPPNRRRTRTTRDRDKRPLRPSLSEDAIGKRHSHGLSWSSNTRDSVVDNLLFSLDTLSKKDGPDIQDIPDWTFDKAKYRVPDMTPGLPVTRTARRARGHTHSSSLSTDYDLSAMPESPPRMSLSSAPKGRRSSSTTKFRRSSTLNSRLSAAKPTNTEAVANDAVEAATTEPPQAPTLTALPNASESTRASTDRGRAESGLDAFFDKKLNRWKRRSMSVDHIFTDAALAPAASIMDRGRPVPSVHSKYDAGYEVAPEPMIAGGPRRKDNPTATGPVFLNQSQARSTLRKITTQTDLRSANAQGPLSPSIPLDVRDRASTFVRMSAMHSRPPTQDRAKGQPSPGLQTHRHFATQLPPQQPSSGSKDRPGFFRRMFGGSSARNAPPQPAPPPTSEPMDPLPSATRNSMSTSSQARTGTRQSSWEGENAAPPIALNKKSSSLFRRRKKSLSEAPPPPPLPSAFSGLVVPPPATSPLDESLSKALDPYLSKADQTGSVVPDGEPGATSRSSIHDLAVEDSDDPDLFYPGYVQRPDAALSARDANVGSAAGQTQLHVLETDSTGKMKVKKRKPENLAPMETSFLLDASASSKFSSTPADSSEYITPVTDIASTIDPLRRQVSKTSTEDRVLSPIASSFAGSDARKQSVVSTVGSERAGSLRAIGGTMEAQKPNRNAQASVEEMLLNSQAALDVDTMFEPLRSPVSPTIQSPISPISQYHSATSLPLTTGQVDSEAPRISTELSDDGAEFRERARKIFEGNEEDVTRAEAAAWLGERNTLSTRTLAAYLELFDFTGVNILAALHLLCGKLTLKGETQQFDRIITALSARWCQCNPNHGFIAQDVVHTICYSLILLNTDLHLADIEGKMSRSAYVKNTLPTIRRVVADAAPNAFDETIRPTTLTGARPSLPWSLSSDSVPRTPLTPVTPAQTASTLQPAEQDRTRSLKASPRPPVLRHDSEGADVNTASGTASNALVNQAWTGTMRGWESEVEAVLKSFFVAIKIDPLPLHGARMDSTAASAERNLSVANKIGVRRTNSVLSKTASDTISLRSKQGLRSIVPGKINGSRSKFYPASTLNSSKTSFDDGNSVWSPAQSTWSKYSFSKTLTSASMQSLGQHFSAANDFKHSIGFANALSQAIIREEQAGLDLDSASVTVPGGLLDDEALTLEGAPWAKEGLVKHKHHLETPGKKAKERNWTDCFAVISKGKLTLFAFNTSTKTASMSRKTLSKNQVNNPSGRAATIGGQKVGGGDWMENAEQLDVFVLRQTIASTLPPPGYSKTRPHVWALNLPSGAVHLFQVGTPEIAREFMSTANYWSARLSKEPLSGGVSNVEYGWSEQVINAALLDRPISPAVLSTVSGANAPLPSISSVSGPRAPGHKHSASAGTMSMQSMTSSLRNSIDTGFGGKPRLPGDKAHLADWQPPTQSMMASQLMEVDQLKALTAYVTHVETELAKHNELKGAIDLAFSPRHSNYSRALSNWQRKSDYLLRENVKFQTYVDSLTKAQQARETFYARKNPSADAAVVQEGSSSVEIEQVVSASPPAVEV